MGDHSSAKKALLPVLITAGFAFFQTTGPAQDTASQAGPSSYPRSSVRPIDRREENSGVRRLGAQLKHFRSIGDLENARRIFALLFPEEDADDPAITLKAAAAVPSNPIGGEALNVKPVVVREGTYPVFVSPQNENNPSADLRRPDDGDWDIFSAAEQWAGDRPRDIRIRKSSDHGLTWPETLVIGDGRASTQPSLRQVSNDRIGVAYVKAWDGTEGDIYFARLSGELAAVSEFPVALSLSDQRDPSIATDRQVYAAPYIYLVYAENEGPSHSVKFRVSQDLGASWSRTVTIDSFKGPDGWGGETAIAFDPDHNALHVAYSRPQGPSTGIALSTSTSFGASWTKPVYLTPTDDRTDSAPAIAARGGTVVVVHETGTGGSGRDIGLAYSSDSGRRWTTDESLASSAAGESSPDVRASDGSGSPKFFASYVENGGRIIILGCDGTAPGSWTTERAWLDQEGSVALGSATILPMPGPDGEESAGAFWTERDGDDDIYFSPAAVTLSLADLTVTPANQDVSYAAGTTSFSVNKTGTGDVSWTAAVVGGQSWLAIQSGESGTNSGTIVAAYEANAGPSPRVGSIQVTATDITIPSVTVTVTQAGVPAGSLEVSPAEGLTSTGLEGGPFTPSGLAYTLRNVGVNSINWRAARIQAWTSLSATSGTLAPGATRTVNVSINATANALAAGTYEDTVTFMNTTNGLGNTTRPVSLTVTAPVGTLTVTPVEGLTSTGPVGGPFIPSSRDYTLRNSGRTSIDWTASKTQAWTTLSTIAGTLAAGASTTVTVSINATANALAAGNYGDTVSFINTTNGSGSTTRPVNLTVSAPPGVLSVAPAGGLASSGPVGGPFSPPSLAYTLQNTGGSPLAWTASANRTWITASPASGDLAAGAAATVTVSINTGANALAAGTYAGTVSVTNATNGNGNTDRPVALTVELLPVLSVSPANRDVSAPAGTTTFQVSNTGAGTLNWTAAVIAGGDWLAIQSGASGTDEGTITAAFAVNRTASARVGLIRVTAPGAAGSPRDVTVTQSQASFSLTLSGQRLVEKAWVIQREFGRLTVTVDNPASIPIETYIVYRRAGNESMQAVQQVDASSITTSPWIVNDAFLEPGTAYTYRIVAVDVFGNIIGTSNEITI